jgi:hypothetical protein
VFALTLTLKGHYVLHRVARSAGLLSFFPALALAKKVRTMAAYIIGIANDCVTRFSKTNHWMSKDFW